MNRHERRRQARINRENQFVRDYVSALPEVDRPDFSKPGVTHMVCYHDEWCGIYDAANGSLSHCTCKPISRYHAEPRRN